jgi:dTDP-4-dehydrorhamnose reductase
MCGDENRSHARTITIATSFGECLKSIAAARKIPAQMQEKQKLAWITGAAGLIGNYLVKAAPEFATDWKICGLAREQFDLLDFKTVEREFQKDKPQLIIHCAAITSVADAQKNPALAQKVNVEVTRFLSQLASEIQFVFLSTDLIFDGQKGNYTETDPPNPLHLYGETKVIAEQIVLRNPRHLVVRTSINGGISRAGDKGFNERLKLSLQNASGMKLFTDEFRSPIFAGETARAVWKLTNKNCSGIFHVAGAEKLSRWQIGQLLVQRWPEIKTKIEPGSTKDFPGPTRAPDTSLDVSKTQKLLSRPLPGLSEWLAGNLNEPF